MTFIDLTEGDTIKQRNLSDLFTTAIEGGMTSGWARITGYRWNAPYAERYATLVDYEDGTEYRLTPDLMATGLRRWYKAMPTRKTECGVALAEAVRTVGSAEFWAGDFDAIDADICAQYAVLADLIYG
jgi:hypothetical protein